MNKGTLSLYIDNELKALAKARGINMSAFFNEVLAVELKVRELADTTTKEELINKLKSRVAMLSTELEEKTTKLDKITKEFEDFKIKHQEPSRRIIEL